MASLSKNMLKPELVESCYTPIVQSGGKYDLRVSASSNAENLHDGVIVCSLGARYKSYCSNISRTYIINPEKDQKVAYELLLKAYQAARACLKPGKRMNEAYAAAEKVLKTSSRKELATCLTKNVGFGVGIEFRDSSMVLSAKNTRIFKYVRE